MVTSSLTAAGPDELAVACWNIEQNGIDEDGARERRDTALEVLEELRPHILLRQEETRAWDNDADLRKEEAERLGLRSVLSEVGTDSRNPVAVLYDEELFAPVEERVWQTAMWKTTRFPVLRLADAPTPFAVVSVHLSHFSPQLRQIAAQRLTTLADHGKSALVGGDFNSYPHSDPPGTLPDWRTVQDPVHYEHRTIWRGDQRVSDTEPDRILAGVTPGGRSVYRELGQYAATELDQPAALTPTATLWRTDQGAAQRIDRMYATSDIASALKRLEVVTDGAVRLASDHALIIARFNLPGLRQALTPAA
ncbi:endonuclease/exonuclease/phosphatase family protein [Streptomyces sp. MP131-18]|uniref:endonuclease/exonuclease/phosphatase family protein n=1 Tax=Streptomyces sp. MP131-18 TaxID=1857892 RepID=UPI0009D3D923|nr:endonuclease/exonuclease/phosphatase family protein [Streptomyces sp. MP131-18]ONK13202.1 Endonuclease/Exonuclease/phosphatase family protein [Streptomyces sp. MP131-18]